MTNVGPREQQYLDRMAERLLRMTPEGLSEEAARSERALSRIEFVRSRYNACWYGVVLYREKRKGMGDLCRVRVVKDRKGNWMRKSYVTTIDEGWLIPCKPWRDISPYYGGDIPYHIKLRREDEAEARRIRRARNKKLKRQWRGLE